MMSACVGQDLLTALARCSISVEIAELVMRGEWCESSRRYEIFDKSHSPKTVKINKKETDTDVVNC